MPIREPDGRHAVPLAEAAARLGVTRDALRMRIRRGKAEGFKRGGQVYVWLQDEVRLKDEAPGPPPAMAARPEARPPSPPAPGGDDWPTVLDLQKQEIARLIRETERLNARLDRHLDEAREMRQMLQREQVLRQQEQSLRRDIQRLLDRLVAHPAFSGTSWTALRPEAARPVADPKDGNERAAPPPRRQAAPDRDRHDENEALAEMLKDIGRSLREAEARDPAGREASRGGSPDRGEDEF